MGDPRTRRLSDDQRASIDKMHDQGMSNREIGRSLGITHKTVGKHLRGEGSHGQFSTGEPLPDDFEDGKIIQHPDGSVDVQTIDHLMKPDEIMEKIGLDPKLYIDRWYKPNTWQSFYKLKEYLCDATLERLISLARGGGSLADVRKSIHAEVGHKKVQLYQSKVVFERKIDGVVENAIKEFMREHVKPLPKPSLSKLRKKRNEGEGEMVCWGLWDAHLGMYAFAEEVGEDYDIKIATKRVKNSVDDMVAELRLYKIERIVMPIGNDYLHFDSMKHETTAGTVLDFDTRYTRVYRRGFECLVYMVERALELCDQVELLYVPGNHDTTSSFGLVHALGERFRNDPRVTVDDRMNPRKYVIHGQTAICFAHGKDANDNSYPLIFGDEMRLDHPNEWFNVRYKEVQIGHKHQRLEKMYKSLSPLNGLLVRMNPSLSNVDAWHHSKAFVGEPMKSVEAWRYRRYGYTGSHVAWARDDERN